MMALFGLLAGGPAAATIAVATTTPTISLGFGLGMLQTAVFAGQSVGPIVGGLVVDSLGYKTVFVLAALTQVIALVIGLTLLKEDHVGKSRDQRLRLGVLLTGLLHNPTGRSLAFLMGPLFLMNVAASAAMPMLPLFAQTLLTPGTGEGTAIGLVTAAGGCAASISALALGRWSDRIGYGNLIVWCSLVGSVFHSAISFVAGIGELSALRVVGGLAMGAQPGTLNALIGSITPESRRGSVYGIATAVAVVGTSAGPLLGATIVATLGLRSVFLATGVLMAVVGAAVWFTGRSLAAAVSSRVP